MRRSPAAPLALLMVLSLVPGRLRPGTPVDKRIKSLTDGLAAELIALREDIHAHPELGLELTRTSALVADRFRKLGLEVRTGFATSGVLGILKGGKSGPVVAMRGDMDALPIIEETGLPFESKVRAVVDGRETGVMHACGHDIHTTMLIGVATVLSKLKAELPGTVLFIAQPGEECCAGAEKMIQDGVFKVAPAVMLLLGVVPADRDKTAVHSPTFVADEAAIPIGVDLMANIIMDYQTRHARAR